MPDLDNSNVTPTTKRVPDYTGKRSEAVKLAKKLEQFYHDKGYTDVKAWVEPEPRNGRNLWGVRSNIVFNAGQLQS